MPQDPLLSFLEKLTVGIPRRGDNWLKKDVPNDDWLLWNLDATEGGKVEDVREG